MRQDLALLVLRMAGLYLACAHGWGKVLALAQGQGGPFVEGVTALGFPFPVGFAWAAALAELVGGVFVALGLFTRSAAGLAGWTMLVAAFFRHRAHQRLAAQLGLTTVSSETLKAWGNPELAIVYLLCFAALVLLGPGGYALDRVLRGKGRTARRK